MKHCCAMLRVVFVLAVAMTLSTPTRVAASPVLPNSTSPAVTGRPTTTSPAENDFNCLLHWLKVSGASRQDIERLVTGDQLVQTHMGEKSIKTHPLFLLTIILNHNRDLAENLKQCIGRLSSCQVSLGSLDYPCSESGECVFNATTRSTVCVCPPGLVGRRCDIDVDECTNPELNNCARDDHAFCTNVHGSFLCTCWEGYYGDGVECVDENECLLGVHDCHNNANCSNTDGSFTCACSHGFRGDGHTCEADICQGSKETALCRTVQKMKEHNQVMEGELHRMHIDMKVMASLLTRYESKLTTVYAKLGQGLSNAAKDRASIREEEGRKCGVVSWRTFTQKTSGNGALAWNAVFNKTRADTVVRVTYTSTFGMDAYNDHWHCFTRSVLINGSECSDPAPIRSGASVYGGNLHDFILPGSISGICNVRQAGRLTFTLHTSKDCGSSGHFQDGYFYGGGDRVTASLHVEELCAN